MRRIDWRYSQVLRRSPDASTNLLEFYRQRFVFKYSFCSIFWDLQHHLAYFIFQIIYCLLTILVLPNWLIFPPTFLVDLWIWSNAEVGCQLENILGENLEPTHSPAQILRILKLVTKRIFTCKHPVFNNRLRYRRKLAFEISCEDHCGTDARWTRTDRNYPRRSPGQRLRSWLGAIAQSKRR